LSKYDITSRLRAAVDREVDPYLHIDMVREEQEQHLQRIKTLERELRALKVTVQGMREWTSTGVWNAVKVRLDAKTVSWVTWATRAALCGVGAAALSALGWLVWRGMKT
jgi:hypothetical protein